MIKSFLLKNGKRCFKGIVSVGTIYLNLSVLTSSILNGLMAESPSCRTFYLTSMVIDIYSTVSNYSSFYAKGLPSKKGCISLTVSTLLYLSAYVKCSPNILKEVAILQKGLPLP